MKVSGLATMSTYGPLKAGGGVGHDVTPGDFSEGMISVAGGLCVFENLLELAVKRLELQRGEQICITIEKWSKN